MWIIIGFVILAILLIVFVMKGTKDLYLDVGEQLQDNLWIDYVKVGEWETDRRKSTKIKVFHANLILNDNELSLYFTHDELQSNNFDHYSSIGVAPETTDVEKDISEVYQDKYITDAAWKRIKELCYELENKQKK